MSYVIPTVPSTCQIAGCLYDSSDRNLLTSDMLEVFCSATNTLICAGWLPEEDLNGNYVIALYRGCERLGDVYRTGSFTEAASVVERMAKRHENALPFSAPIVYREVSAGGVSGMVHIGSASNPTVEYA